MVRPSSQPQPRPSLLTSTILSRPAQSTVGGVPALMLPLCHRYRLAGLPGEHQQRNISSPEVNYCLVTDLIIWTQYEIQVAAYNGAGLGVFSRAVTEYTLQGGELPGGWGPLWETGGWSQSGLIGICNSLGGCQLKHRPYLKMGKGLFILKSNTSDHRQRMQPRVVPKDRLPCRNEMC